MMDAELKQKWIAALRSGKYPQGTGYLQTADGFCCLGVLCDVAGLKRSASKKSKGDFSSFIFYEFPNGKTDGFCLDKDFMYSIGLDFYTMNRLADMNDDGSSFDFIAGYIEKNA
jgi:hypothetical protein